MGLASIEVTDAQISFFSHFIYLFSAKTGFPLRKKKKQTSHQIFPLHISAKSEYFKLLTMKETGSGAGVVFIFRTHSLARLSGQSQPLLSLPSEFGSSPQGAG